MRCVAMGALRGLVFFVRSSGTVDVEREIHLGRISKTEFFDKLHNPISRR